MEVRELDWPDLAERSEWLRAGLPHGLSIEVGVSRARTGPGSVDKNEGLGKAGLAQGLSIKVRDWALQGPCKTPNTPTLHKSCVHLG